MRWRQAATDDQKKRDLAGRQAACERDLEAAEQAGDDLARAVAYNNLGTVHADLDDWEQALECYEQAAAVVPDEAELDDRATPHGNAANAARRLKDWPKALSHALWVDALGTQAGDGEQQAVAVGAVGLVRKAVGDEFANLLAEAVSNLPEALREHVRQDQHLNPTVREEDRPGRNDPCWCGSGKKYKQCHLKSDLRGES